jgi:hypothetical protein
LVAVLSNSSEIHVHASFLLITIALHIVKMGSAADSSQVNEDNSPRIIDIRSDTAGFELKKLIKDGLKPQDGDEKTLPTLLLYDNNGLKLFEDITYLEEYYLTGQEIAVLEKHAGSMAERIPQDAILVELGSGYGVLNDLRQGRCTNV